ncbi:uncharacterized protein LOC111884643 [Lactuca sativa]|uniref:uncharacterized protein LOC111884643 n=1 Tax=Lactuca sativa TaxID=4236 RepID=UPI000CD845F2|nr:uncharacterized protein LOC111884643 [Lactuca sativa]
MSEKDQEEQKKDKSNQKKPFITEAKVTLAPFPGRLSSSKKEWEDNEIMQMFRKVEVNIPLPEAIKQRFCKEGCPQSARIPLSLPCHANWGIFMYLTRVMLDLGSSINALPYSIYKSIGVGTLRKTGVIIQLVDRPIIHPKGVLKYLLVPVNELIFSADFYVLDMGDDDSPNSSSILLGKPFLKTSKTKIDVYNGTLSMEFYEEVTNFNIYEAMRYPSNLVFSQGLDKDKIKELERVIKIDKDMLEMVNLMDDKKHLGVNERKDKLPTTDTKLLPLVIQPPKLELKTLPNHLKYA